MNKRNGLFLVSLLALLLVAVSRLFAITLNPASNALADSANTAQTIVLRDASGNFQAGTITSQLPVETTAQLALDTDAVGTLKFAAENNQTTGVAVTNAYNECVSTAAKVASYVYIAVSTNSAGATPAVAGATCSK